MSVKSHRALSTGYSGTPLAQKLGIGAGTRACAIDAPGDYRALVAPWPEEARLVDQPDRAADLVHLFVNERSALVRQLLRLRKSLRDDTVLWVSWPKQAAKVPTDISEDTIGEVALPLGFVDVKVCAVDAVWSGLKLVVRRELRASPRA